MKRVEISDKFWADPCVEDAQSRSQHAVGIFVRGLTFMAEHGWDPSPGSDRCFGPVFYVPWMPEGTVQYRRPALALERAGLWERVTNPLGRTVDAWWFLGAGELWRIKPLRESISASVRELVMERDGRTCQICMKEIPGGEAIHLDHIVPVSQYGRSTVENLRVTHAACNLRKGRRRDNELAEAA